MYRRILKRLHPQGIPWPFSVVYNAISGTAIFDRHYALAARDAARYGVAASVLDIGTGPGHLLTHLRRVFPNAALTGIDISPGMIAQARRNRAGDPGTKLEIASAASLPFPDSSFDFVISTGSLHHWKQPVAALAEAHRVLRPGGHALIHDLVLDLPKPIAQDVRKEFGGFRLTLLWLHSFEEPFLNAGEMETLGRQSPFQFQDIHFVGALCCLALRKEA